MKNHYQKTKAFEMQNWNADQKREALLKMREHYFVHGTKHKKNVDKGTRRPWDTSSVFLLIDEIKAGTKPIDIAFLTRRCPVDVLAMINIIKWVMKESPFKYNYKTARALAIREDAELSYKHERGESMLTIYTKKWTDGKSMEWTEAMKVIIWLVDNGIGFLVIGPGGTKITGRQLEEYLKGH